MAIVNYPTIPQPSGPNDIVGLVFNNANASPLPARKITFLQAFEQGKLSAGTQIQCVVGGNTIQAQYDVKTSNDDGSVCIAQVSLEHPSLPANSSTNAMLTVGSGGGVSGGIVRLRGTPVRSVASGNMAIQATAQTVATPNVSLLAFANSGVTATATIALSGGGTFNLDLIQMLKDQLLAGAVSFWMRGPVVTEGRIQTFLQTSLWLQVDFRVYSDDTWMMDFILRNDIAMQISGGQFTYDVSITQNGTTVFSQSSVVHKQYRNWHKQFWSNGSPQVNVQKDYNSFARAGVIYDLDTTIGVDSTVLNSITSTTQGSAFIGILMPAAVDVRFPDAGIRPDIGPLSAWGGYYFGTQTLQQRQNVRLIADVSGSVPWNYYDITNQTEVRLANYPKLQPNTGTSFSGVQRPTQLPDFTLGYTVGGRTSWTLDVSHCPTLAPAEYLISGDRWYYDQTLMEACHACLWSNVGNTGSSLGVPSVSAQGRTKAWLLRNCMFAMIFAVDSATQQAYSNIVGNNLDWFITDSNLRYGAEKGIWGTGQDPYDIVGDGSISAFSLWMNGYIAQAMSLAAKQGFAQTTLLYQGKMQFRAGSLLNGVGADPNNGTERGVAGSWSPWNAVTERCTLENWVTGTNLGGPPGPARTPLATWADVYAFTQAYPSTSTPSVGVGAGKYNDSQYMSIAYSELAASLTFGGIDPYGLEAFVWYATYAKGASGTQLKSLWQTVANRINFASAVRFPSGNLLTWDKMTFRNDSTTTTVNVVGGGPQMVIQQGSGNTTINGGAGENILMQNGSGTAVLNGGAGMDWLYAGYVGNTTLYGAGGVNYMKAGNGVGVATFNLKQSDVATDTIGGFRVGTDTLHLLEGSPTAATIVATKSDDGAGGTNLTVGPSHTLNLAGVPPASVTVAIFS